MGQRHSRETERNVQRIRANGHKINPDKTLNAWKVPATSEFPVPAGRPEYMWVETGDERSGLQHMQTKGRDKDFAKAGIPESEQRQKLPVLAEAHTTVGRYVGRQGKDRPIMATFIEGHVHRNALTVGNNGYVVSMNPVSSGGLKLRPGDPGFVSDRTMQNLYSYPPNRPDRRATEQPKHSDRVRAPRRDATL